MVNAQFDRQIAKQLWDQLQQHDGIKITSFDAIEVFETDKSGERLVVATANITVALEVGPDSGVIFELMSVEVQLGKDGKIYLEEGLHLSPELRAVLTHWVTREKAAELRSICETIKAANQPEAAEGLPAEVAVE